MIMKIKHQIKSNMYYVFWGACTVAVVLGQVYVGTGYRDMSESIDNITKYLVRPKLKIPYEMPIIR